MYPSEFDEFKQSLSDLCVAVNRPFTDDLARVFWEDLKRFPLPQVQERAKYQRAAGKRNFTSNDLRPEPEPTRPANTYNPPPSYDDFHSFGQRCLFAFIRRAEHQIEEPELQALIAVKNRLVNDFRGLNAEDEVTAEQMREALMRGFGKAMVQRAAA